VHKLMSALPPCVDGSELARTFLNVCSIGRCSHVFGLLALPVGPLAIMPCADQVPINSPHSRIRFTLESGYGCSRGRQPRDKVAAQGGSRYDRY